MEMKPAEAGNAYWTEFRIPGVDLSKFHKFEIVLVHPEINGEIPLVQSGLFGARATSGQENISSIVQSLGLKKPNSPSLVIHGEIPGAIVPDKTAPNGFFRPLAPESSELASNSVQVASTEPYKLKIFGDGDLIANATLKINPHGTAKASANLPTANEQRMVTDKAVDRLTRGEELKVLDIRVEKNKFTSEPQRSVIYDLGDERLKVTVTRDGTKLSDDGVNHESMGVMAEILERPDSSFGYTTAINDKGVPEPNPKLENLVSRVLSDFSSNSASTQELRSLELAQRAGATVGMAA